MIQPDMQSITLVYRQSVTHTDNASASGRSTTLPTNSYQLSNLTDHISFDVGNANAKRINVKTCANFLKTEYECDTWFRRTEDTFYNSRWSTKSVNNINQSIVLVFFSVNFPSLVWTLIKLNSLNLLYVQYRIRILETLIVSCLQQSCLYLRPFPGYYHLFRVLTVCNNPSG